MALSYNLGYQESISVHPTRRPIFAGKPYSTFPNIWQWVIFVLFQLLMYNGRLKRSWQFKVLTHLRFLHHDGDAHEVVIGNGEVYHRLSLGHHAVEMVTCCCENITEARFSYFLLSFYNNLRLPSAMSAFLLTSSATIPSHSPAWSSDRNEKAPNNYMYGI